MPLPAPESPPITADTVDTRPEPALTRNGWHLPIALGGSRLAYSTHSIGTNQ